jgi:two-component system, OmpR family, KDP operon response regulator KdpE
MLLVWHSLMSELTQPTLKKKILLVDDDPVVLKATSIKLKAMGYDVMTAADGSTGVSAARTMKPDLLILDISFPPDFGNVDWDGFRVMEWLKRLEGGEATPIVVVTSGDPAKFEARAKQAGAAAFFRKPVNFDQLAETIQQVLVPEPVKTPVQ